MYLIIDPKTRVKIKAGKETDWNKSKELDKYTRILSEDDKGVLKQLIIIDRGENTITPKGQRYIEKLASEHEYKLTKKVKDLNCYEANAIINKLTGSDWPEKYIPGREVRP